MTVLVIDIGSSSVRALLFDDALQPVPGAIATRPYQFTRVPPGASVVNADRLRELTESSIDEILRHPAAAGISVVGMATFVGNILGVDDRGLAVTPVFTYADNRSHDDVLLLREQIDTNAAHQRTGCPMHTAYLPGRLHWLMRTDFERFERVDCWMVFSAYLYTRWFGETFTSYSVASWSGMLDETTLDWDATWLDVLGLSNGTLPPLADYHEARCGLKDPYAQRWPVLRDIPFCLALGDGAAANIGSGGDNPSRIVLTVGTTAALRIVTDHPPRVLPSTLWRYLVQKDRYLIGGATTEGGGVFAWARTTLKLSEPDLIEKELSQRPPDTHGLTVLPLLGGERSPGYLPNATGTIHGLRLSTAPMDILQAVLESIALRLNLIFRDLLTAAEADPILIAGGGALHASPVWAQMIANTLNYPLHLTEDGEVTARGVALLALQAIHDRSVEHIEPLIQTVVEPDPQNAIAMQTAQQRQTALYERLYGRDRSSKD